MLHCNLMSAFMLVRFASTLAASETVTAVSRGLHGGQDSGVRASDAAFSMNCNLMSALMLVLYVGAM